MLTGERTSPTSELSPFRISPPSPPQPHDSRAPLEAFWWSYRSFAAQSGILLSPERFSQVSVPFEEFLFSPIQPTRTTQRRSSVFSVRCLRIKLRTRKLGLHEDLVRFFPFFSSSALISSLTPLFSSSLLGSITLKIFRSWLLLPASAAFCTSVVAGSTSSLSFSFSMLVSTIFASWLVLATPTTSSHAFRHRKSTNSSNTDLSTATLNLVEARLAETATDT